MNNLTINTDRLLHELHTLATITDCPPTTDATLPSPTTAVTRIVFTPRDLEARAYIASLAKAAGFTLRVDAIGNTFIRLQGSDPTLPAVGTGSHTDAIPHAGMYDGTVGVLGGLEAMRSLKESGFQPKRSIETLMFTSEEPTRFGIGCIGSRLLGNSIAPTTADALPDRLPETDPKAPTGLTLHQVRTAAGFTAPLSTVPLPPHYYHAWVELHIEQGPLLERAMLEAQTSHASEGSTNHQVPQGFSLGSHNPEKSEGALAPAETTILGIVTNIAAPASYRYEITGFGGHAGALLMPDRRDALCAASELILSVERHTLAANARAKSAGHSGVDSVATIGTVAVHPGAVNSVPSRVTLMLDIRDTDVSRRAQTMSALHADIRDIESRRQVTITEQKINADVPAISDPHILSTLEAICTTHNIPYKKMVARAYHDTNFIAPIAPVAMLFIPCRNGVSHRPDEYSTPESIALGTRVLALALAKLASE
ncbi:MAG: M20 family metallo-hydrolase [Acidobacteriaceae bacterium]